MPQQQASGPGALMTQIPRDWIPAPLPDLSSQAGDVHLTLLDLHFINRRPLPLDRKMLHRLLNVRTYYQEWQVEAVLNTHFNRTPQGWLPMLEPKPLDARPCTTSPSTSATTEAKPGT